MFHSAKQIEMDLDNGILSESVLKAPDQFQIRDKFPKGNLNGRYKWTDLSRVYVSTASISHPVHSFSFSQQKRYHENDWIHKVGNKVRNKVTIFETATFPTRFSQSKTFLVSKQRQKKNPHSNRSNETNNKLSYCIEFYLLYPLLDSNFTSLIRHSFGIHLNSSFRKYKLISSLMHFKFE